MVLVFVILMIFSQYFPMIFTSQGHISLGVVTSPHHAVVWEYGNGGPKIGLALLKDGGPNIITIS